MKKHYYIYPIIAFALVLSIPATSHAEESADTDGSVQERETMMRPPAPGTTPTPRPGTPVPAALREQLRAKTENIQNNVEIRNKILENRRPATSTRPLIATSTRMERKEIRDDRREEVMETRREGREEMKNATNTPDRREIRRDMRKDIFQIRKEALIKQLNVSIENLKQVRERIVSRIDKATSAGRDMAAAKSALAIADAKIATAISALETLKSYTPPTPTASSTDPTSIDLTKPRQIADAALKAVKDAHESLTAVVRAIARAMGLGGTASTTPTTTP